MNLFNLPETTSLIAGGLAVLAALVGLVAALVGRYKVVIYRDERGVKQRETRRTVRSRLGCLSVFVFLGIAVLLVWPHRDALWKQSERLLSGPTPEEVLQRAVDAAGGKDALAKVTAVYQYAEGYAHPLAQAESPAPPSPVRIQSWFVYPDRYRQDVVLLSDPNGPVLATNTLALNKETGWIAVNRRRGPLPEGALHELKQTWHLQRVMQLAPLLRDDGFGLDRLPGETINGRTAVGIKVTHPNFAPIELYFDGDSYRLLRAQVQFSLDGTLKTYTMLVSDHQQWGGITQPSQVVVQENGRTTLELSIKEAAYPESITEQKFQAP